MEAYCLKVQTLPCREGAPARPESAAAKPGSSSRWRSRKASWTVSCPGVARPLVL